MHSVWCQCLSGLSEMSVGDWINSGMLFVAVVVLFFTARAFCLQAQATDLQTRAIDFSNYFDLMAQFSDAWHRYRDAAEKHKEYELFDLLNLIEASCHLDRLDRLGRASKEMMEEKLKELIKA